MQLNDGKERSANGTAPRRWAWMVLCLLLAVGMLLNLGHATPVQAHADTVQITTASDGAKPCEPGHAAIDEHCHAPSVCPLFAPAGAQAVVLHGASAHRSPDVEQNADSRVIDPSFRPPRLSLHA